MSRPLYGRCAQANAASLRVLRKCGFVVVEEGVWYSNAHGKEVGEYVLRLDA